MNEIALVIRQGATTGSCTLRVAGYEVELLPLIDKHRERYAGWIATSARESWPYRAVSTLLG